MDRHTALMNSQQRRAKRYVATDGRLRVDTPPAEISISTGWRPFRRSLTVHPGCCHPPPAHSLGDDRVTVLGWFTFAPHYDAKFSGGDMTCAIHGSPGLPARSISVALCYAGGFEWADLLVRQNREEAGNTNGMAIGLRGRTAVRAAVRIVKRFRERRSSAGAAGEATPVACTSSRQGRPLTLAQRLDAISGVVEPLRGLTTTSSICESLLVRAVAATGTTLMRPIGAAVILSSQYRAALVAHKPRAILWTAVNGARSECSVTIKTSKDR
ncbi:hypothetical protein GLOTRDRAFT_97327, partial [Gloeophyllum trabeum ATCC 11539]